MGIRRKISLGFICLALMLFFSGMISLSELNKMSKATQDIFESSSSNIELSKEMLDAVQGQNAAMLQIVLSERTELDSVYLKAHAKFEHSLAYAVNCPELDSVYAAKADYDLLIDNYFNNTEHKDPMSFMNDHKISYHRLVESVKNYMMYLQHSLVSKISQLKSNAYRAITPGILTLCVAIMMIIVFWFLIDMYYTRPISDIMNGVKNYVNSKTPFNVKVEGRDDILQLKEYIEALINQTKNKNKA